MMTYSFNIGAELKRGLSEEELDNLIKDLWAFKVVARTSGKLFNKPNYIFNIYDETEFNEATEKFEGIVRVYFESNTYKVGDTVDDIAALFSKYECQVVQIVRKFKVNNYE